MSVVTAWSPSRLFEYETCPAKMKWKTIDRLCPMCFKGKLKGGFDSPAVCDTCQKTQELAPALARGSRLDKAIEDFITGKVPTMDTELNGIGDTLAKMRVAYQKKKVKLQLQIAVRKDWTLTDYFAKDVYARFKLDAFYALPGGATVIDWKSGKFRPDSDEYQSQLDAYKVATLSAGLTKKVTSKLVFIDAGKEVPGGTAKLEDLPKMHKQWDKRVLPLLNDTRFAPAAGPGCKWCDYSKAKGGPCPY